MGIFEWWSDRKRGKFVDRISKSIEAALKLERIYISQGNFEAAEQLSAFVGLFDCVISKFGYGKCCPFCGNRDGETLGERFDLYLEEFVARCRKCGMCVGLGHQVRRIPELAQPIESDERHATIVEMECPTCGQIVTLKAPSGTFHTQCPNCNATEYIGP